MPAALAAGSSGFAVFSGFVEIRQVEGKAKRVPASIADPVAGVKRRARLRKPGQDRPHVIARSSAARVRAWYVAREVARVANSTLVSTVEATEVLPFETESPYFGILRRKAR